MAIACAYCGGTHPSPGDVRACWERSRAAEPATVVADLVLPDPLRPDPVRPESVARPPRLPTAEWGRPGPAELARGLVIREGSPVLQPWADAERVVIDRTVLVDPAPTVAILQDFAAARQRLVIELADDAVEACATAPRSIELGAPYALGPRFWFPLDVLHHLIWSNAIDATGPTPRWSLLERAMELGAQPIEEAAGDIRCPDGSPAWLDGGPIRRSTPIDGVPILHAVCVEHGSLLPPSSDTATNGSLAELAADQHAAVVHDGAAARIIAPAGSGKTRVLTERARHLLRTWRVPASALSLVAFNKRAQLEIQDRTRDLRGLNVRTLNAIALAIVNGNAPFLPQARRWRTIDEVEVRRIIGRLVQFPRRRNTDPVASWIEALSMIRLGLRSPDQVESAYNGDVDGLAEMWPRYRAALERDDLLDFDEQIYRAIELLLIDPDVRDAAQRACRLLLVDEFQDLTPAHVLLVRLLAAPGFGVFGVGDDDQTIYGYSGADPEWLIDFRALFPHAGAHPLEVNYRCPGDVVAAADRLVRHNGRRVPKAIRSIRPETRGLRIVDAGATLPATLHAIGELVRAGRAPGEIAVLTRVNALLAPVQVGLIGDGIAVQGGVGTEFLERTAVRAALAWIRLAVGGPEALGSNDLAEALRRPSRPMHPNVANWVAEQNSIVGLRKLAGRINTDRDAARVASFADDIARLQLMAKSSTAAALLRSLADDIGLDAAIATLDDGRHGMNRAAQNDDLVALTQLAGLHSDPVTFGDWLRSQLSTPRSADGVVLATVHRVKGQEWPCVVLHHAEADQYPHRLAEDLEEERRVFHVAITRGSAEVVVVVGETPSPFVEEMMNEPTDRPRRSQAEPPFVTTTTAHAPTRATQKRETAFDKATVLAAPGLVIVDGGQQWIIEAVEEAAVITRHEHVTRRFSFGSAVVTSGRQRGTLRRPTDDGPGEPSIRAHDLLRQARERLRSGKPAYVVFDDKTLEAIALALPMTLADLARIPGIGPAKLEQYGDAVLVAVEDAISNR